MNTWERVHFRLIEMPCCHTLYCHINPRLPNYCPECGKRCYAEVKSGIHTHVEFAGWLTNAREPVIPKDVAPQTGAFIPDNR